VLAGGARTLLSALLAARWITGTGNPGHWLEQAAARGTAREAA